MSKTKEVSTRPNNLPSEFEENDELIGLLPRAEASDFDIPRLTLVQPTSKIEGSQGDIVDSSSNQVICKLGEKLVFAPVWFLKDFSVTEVDSKKFRRNEPKTAQNAHFSIFDNRVGRDPDGIKVERKERLNVFLVQKSSLEEDLPRMYRLLIKPSGFKSAKKLLAEWDIAVRTRQAPYSYLWSMKSRMVTNDSGKFAVIDFDKEMSGNRQDRLMGKDLEKVKFWVKTLAANQEHLVKPDESEMREVNSSDDVPF